MKKILSALTLMSLVALTAHAAETQQYVVWKTGDTRSNFRAEAVGGTTVRQLKHIDGSVANLTVDQVAKLKSQGFKVERTQTMHVLGHRHAQDSDTPLPSPGGVPWGITAIQAPDAQKLPNGSGEGVVICVVDTGIASDHPALKGRVIGGDAIVQTTAKGKDAWYDDMGHGTHVSGTMAGDADGLLGVAPAAQLYAIKVLGADGSGTDADVADGIKACIGHGQVINLSLGGGGFSQVIQDSMDAVVKAKIQMACAAGNDGTAVEAPANQKGCTAVSAVDSSGKLADFSCFGKQIKFAAPGVGVISSVPGGKFEQWDGTSMATPHVAGTMAVELSRKKSKLKGKHLSGLNSNQQGTGQINALLTAQ